MTTTNATDHKKITLRTSAATLNMLRAVADTERRSINNMLERMILIYSKTYHYGVWKSHDEKRKENP